MSNAYWFLIVGALLGLMAYLRHIIERLPVSTAMIYLLVGFALGPSGAGVFEFDLVGQRELLETLAEIAVLISLFTAGIKLRAPLRSTRWNTPVLLATLSMTASVGLVALFGAFFLGLTIGLGVLVAAILAPTDPVLAADVKLRDPNDRDQLRYALTGEGAMNDGSAFPFVFLGLGLLGLHQLGPLGVTWVLRDLLWGPLAGLAIGFVVGHGAAWAAKRMRQRRADAVQYNEFLLLGVIAISYGAATAVQALGFLAVLAAAVAVRRFDVEDTSQSEPDPSEAVAPDLLHLNEQLERLLEVAVVLLVGALISAGYWSWTGLAFAAFLLLVARPLSVRLVLHGTGTSKTQRRFISWFGIRGVGSVYYVAFAVGEGIGANEAAALFATVFTVVAVSVVVHGVSATPLMALYDRRARR